MSGLLLASCDNTEEVNYTAKVYDENTPNLSISVSNFDEAAGSFDIVMNADGNGTAFYAITAPGVTSTASGLINAKTDALGDGSESLTAGTAATVSFDQVGPYRTLEVHALMTSVDGFGTKIVKQTVTIPDTTVPVLLERSPGHQAGGLEFNNQSITFTFDEPVKLVSGAQFDFSIFENGVGIVDQFSLTDPTFTLGGDVIGDYATEVTISGWNGLPNNFTIVAYAAGMFEDQDGLLNASSASGFGYYFRARQLTKDEVATKLVGDWTYLITNNAFNPIVLSGTTGTWSVTKGSMPGTIMLSNQVDHDINNFLGSNDSGTTEFEVTVGDVDELGPGAGYLFMNARTSDVVEDLYGDGTVAYWTPFFQNLITPIQAGLAGFYDFNAKQIMFRVDFGSLAGAANTATYFGDIQYDYNYVPGSGNLGRSAAIIPSNEILKVEGATSSVNNISIDDFLNTKSLEKGQLNTVVN